MLKRLITCIIVFFYFFSCNKDNPSRVIYPTSPTEAFRLIRWESQPWTSYTDYHYNSRGLLDSITAWEGDLYSRTEFDYNSVGLIRQEEYYTGFENLFLARRSTYHYNQNGRLDSIHLDHFSKNTGFIFSSAEIFTYQSDSTLKEIFERYPSTGTFLRTTMEWADGNIISQTDFNSDGSILNEQNFSYDDKINWQRTTLPYSSQHPYISSRNSRVYPNAQTFYNRNNYPDSILFTSSNNIPPLEWRMTYRPN